VGIGLGDGRDLYPWSLPMPLDPTMTMVGSTWSAMSSNMCRAFLACQAWQDRVTLSCVLCKRLIACLTRM
jgi:hypothetical protein